MEFEYNSQQKKRLQEMLKKHNQLLEQAKADKKEAEVAKKASGKQKLKDLGLDDDEIKQLTGA